MNITAEKGKILLLDIFSLQQKSYKDKYLFFLQYYLQLKRDRNVYNTKLNDVCPSICPSVCPFLKISVTTEPIGFFSSLL